MRGVWRGSPSLPPASRLGRQSPPPMRWSNRGEGGLEGSTGTDEANCTARRLRGGCAGSCSGEETSGLRSAPQGHLVPSDMRALHFFLPCMSEPQSRQVQKQCCGSRPHTPPPGLRWGHIFTSLPPEGPQNLLPAERPSKLTPGGGEERRGDFTRGMIAAMLQSTCDGVFKASARRARHRTSTKSQFYL